MPEAPTAEERLRQVRRARRRARTERLARQVAAPLWRAVRTVVPTVFPLAGELHVRRLLAPRGQVLDALCPDAVLALDTAMRLHCGTGCLHGGDLHAYVTDASVLHRLAARGLVASEESSDRTLVRPWPGPPRLFAVRVDLLPPHDTRADGTRLVTRERLLREVIGAVGPRLDVLAPLLVGTD